MNRLSKTVSHQSINQNVKKKSDHVMLKKIGQLSAKLAMITETEGAKCNVTGYRIQKALTSPTHPPPPTSSCTALYPSGQRL